MKKALAQINEQVLLLYLQRMILKEIIQPLEPLPQEPSPQQSRPSP